MHPRKSGSTFSLFDYLYGFGGEVKGNIKTFRQSKAETFNSRINVLGGDIHIMHVVKSFLGVFRKKINIFFVTDVDAFDGIIYYGGSINDSGNAYGNYRNAKTFLCEGMPVIPDTGTGMDTGIGNLYGTCKTLGASGSQSINYNN